MVKMKIEFSTPKDLEKLRVELSGKMGGGIDPNHPDMGPIMDSLIMTNDRPHIDCSTITPMTGNGSLKFERFFALNKSPRDEIIDKKGKETEEFLGVEERYKSSLRNITDLEEQMTQADMNDETTKLKEEITSLTNKISAQKTNEQCH